MRQDDATERAGSVVVDPGIGRELVAAPQHDRLAASLEEDGLLYFLAVPTELLVKGARPPKVRDTEGDETDALFHAVDRIRCYAEAPLQRCRSTVSDDGADGAEGCD